MLGALAQAVKRADLARVQDDLDGSGARALDDVTAGRKPTKRKTATARLGALLARMERLRKDRQRAAA